MARHMSLVALVLAFFLLVPAPITAGDDGVEDAIEALSDALGESELDARSVELLKDFLAEYPDTKYTAAALAAIAYYEGESMGDRDGAVAFIKKHIGSLANGDHIRGSNVVLAELYNKPEYQKELRGLARELADAGGLSFHQYSTLITTALGAEDWEIALEMAGPAVTTASPESVLADYPDAPEETVQDRSRGRMVDLDVYKGWALANTGDAVEALELFDSAEERSDFDYFDTPEGMLYVYWGKALLMGGEVDAALDKLLPMALWAESETALDAVKAIYEKNGGDPLAFEDYLFGQRLATARTIDGFSAVDYEGNVRSSKDLMGKVTLVAFWFPT